MQTADTIEQRIRHLYQRKGRVRTIADLLSVVHHQDDLRSQAFKWELFKLSARPSVTPQDYNDFRRDLSIIDRYGSVAPDRCPLLDPCSIGAVADRGHGTTVP